MDRAWLNSVNKYPPIDPRDALVKLRGVEINIAQSDLPPRTRSLRTNLLKRKRELREACLFCFGASERFVTPVLVCPIEDADFDFLARWQEGETTHFSPIQLKELVPQDLNPNASLQSVLDELARYRDSEKLTVAIHFSRRTQFDPSTVNVPKIKMSGLWVFGSIVEDQSRWMMYGNMLDRATFSTFSYPI